VVFPSDVILDTLTNIVPALVASVLVTACDVRLSPVEFEVVLLLSVLEL